MLLKLDDFDMQTNYIWCMTNTSATLSLLIFFAIFSFKILRPYDATLLLHCSDPDTGMGLERILVERIRGCWCDKILRQSAHNVAGEQRCSLHRQSTIRQIHRSEGKPICVFLCRGRRMAQLPSHVPMGLLHQWAGLHPESDQGLYWLHGFLWVGLRLEKRFSRNDTVSKTEKWRWKSLVTRIFIKLCWKRVSLLSWHKEHFPSNCILPWFLPV